MAMMAFLVPSQEQEPCQKMKERRLMAVQYFIRQPGDFVKKLLNVQ